MFSSSGFLSGGFSGKRYNDEHPEGFILPGAWDIKK
jgi:hypothetical protein